MADHKKNNNLLYAGLVLAGILLLLIPFFIFNIGDSINGTSHLTRFGLHILAFVGAILAGSFLSTGIANAATSGVTMKVVAISSAVVVGTVVTVNTIQYSSNPNPPNLGIKADSASLIAIADSVNTDDTANTTDTSSIVSTEELSTANTDEPASITNTESEPKNNINSSTNITGSKNLHNNNNTIADKSSTNKSISSENKSIDKTNNSMSLQESCQTFQVVHGSKQLDRKLGLSVYDPNKTIKFNNDCGCVLKEATMSLSRKNEVLEQKIQNGNFINLHTFKDLQVDDKLSIEIRKATCKDNTGALALYTFPKPILTVIMISDHREFETASELKTNKKTTSTTPIDNTIKTSPKDKVEDELNKYGN